ncbi:UNVERIFIED_CONTAM: Sister chromatid cohesion 1 protein 4 [Sesamum latifolium]|uniref:Sister chromatid cohesion 1 protein 4 n=1 Tax=Sesamum latifolium TaxID=2727402 RepID=A0AAW2TDG1_9LAMI
MGLCRLDLYVFELSEFLNVDDDELTEIADDMDDAEETRYTENSGWSSRTRAVSKYLQSAFAKEAECGRKSLSLDNLLTGKSRKEASRMFFETLVLKTRDYIHVEQQNPFDDITIKPRTRLMKSDF